MKQFSQQLSRLLILCPVLFWGLALQAQAHEFWIEPDIWNAPSGQAQKLSLRVGTGFKGNSQPDLPIEQLRFDIVAPNGDTKPAGLGFAADPAGKMQPTGDGAWRAVFQNKGKSSVFSLTKFLPYLQESGLDAEHAELDGKPGTWEIAEEFRRNAVYLNVVGEAPAGPLNPVGLTLELVPQNNPSVLTAGQDFVVQLLWKGKPLAGRLVYVMGKGQGEKRLAAVYTDADGRAALPIGKAGPVLITAVHIEKARFESRSYISDWATLTVDMN